MWLLENAMDGTERLFCSTKQAKTYTSTKNILSITTTYSGVIW